MVSEWATFTEEHAMSTTSYDFAVRQAGGTPGMNKLPSWTSTTNSSGLTAPQLDLNAILKNSSSASGSIANFNINQVPNATQASLASTLLAGSTMDQATSATFYNALNKVLPTWNSDIIGTGREAIQQTSSLARQLMTGELPQDVQDAINRTTAESGNSRGAFGQALNFASARNVGQTSLDMKMAGANMYGSVVSPLASSLLSNALQLKPKQTDLQSLFSGTQGALLQANTVNAGTGAQTALQVALQNADYNWSSVLSNMNLSQDQAQMRVNAAQTSRNNAMNTSLMQQLLQRVS
jgi:hypothetical protein